MNDVEGMGEDRRGRREKTVVGAPEESRHLNRSRVLELIRTRGPVSRIELARVGNLSTPTVIGIVGELVNEGLVREDGVGPSTGGRRPILLKLVENARCAIGVSVGSRMLTSVVTALDGEVQARLEGPSEMEQGPEILSERVKEILGRTIESIPDGVGIPLGIGLAVPAPVTVATSEMFSPPTYQGWGRMQLRELVAEAYSLPVLVDNVANAAAIGEHLFGAGLGTRHMFYVVAHRGIGGAAIINGSIYRGAEGVAGELGHTRIELDGPRCGCGNYGCLEAFVGRVAIRLRAVRLLKISGRNEMSGRDVDKIRAQDVIEAALQGDEIAREVLRETGKYLGIGISNAMHLFNPELVVVGGSTMQAGEFVLKPAIEVARQQGLSSVTAKTGIVLGQLGEEAGAVGAAALVLRDLFAFSLPQGGV